MKTKNLPKKIIRKISLVDKCLLLIMLILLVQSMHNLFANEIISENTNAIDTIVRTSASAIFGYFLSGNFLNMHYNGGNENEKSECEEKKSAAVLRCSKQQIIIITSIGLVSLFILLYLRNFVVITESATETISQLRDFVSATVGFLVGCGKGYVDEKK